MTTSHDIIGHYRLLGKVGEGGMGALYAARHLTMGHYAAIKRLLPDRAGDRTREARLLHEARAAAIVDHPGVVKVFDQGVLEDGSSYIVMELLRGETLAERLERCGRLDLLTALIFVRQIGRAMAAAHRSGVVHRDLKPGNLFIVADAEVEGGERIKVLDFGIAKLGSESTSPGYVGTPAYMPPEQWHTAGDVDARTDVYALGCVLFEMICGRRAFPGRETIECFELHCFQPPPMAKEIDPLFPEEIDDLIRTALAKDPDVRFQSMQELTGAVEEIRSRRLPRIASAVGGELVLQSTGQACPKVTSRSRFLRRRSAPTARCGRPFGAAIGGRLSRFSCETTAATCAGFAPISSQTRALPTTSRRPLSCKRSRTFPTSPTGPPSRDGCWESRATVASTC
jgi:serine/threonine-protein kinase